MRKTTLKFLSTLIALFSVAACDNSYEFPKSPYPRIETLPVINISKTGVTFQARITQMGQKQIINHGFAWGLEQNPSITYADNIQLGSAPGTGNFQADVKSGLYEGKEYFVRAFVATENYVVYGKAVSFSSKGSTAPVIESLSPQEGTWGDTIAIKGSYFSALPKNNSVKFGTRGSKVVASTDSTIMCIVPGGVETLQVSVSVEVAGNTAESPDKFHLTVPHIDGISPASGTFLDEVTITGSNFGALRTHLITVGGHPAQIVAFNRTSLTIKIPLEVELKTNEIKVTLNQQTATSPTSFTILPPTVTSVSNTEGHVGDEVEITGENFNPRLQGNLVLFGESQATVLSATNQSLKVKLTNGVYPQRVNTIKVTVAEQTATAASTFKMLDAWLNKGYTPVAEVSCGGFAIDNTGYFIAASHTYSYDPLTNSWEQKAEFPGEFRLSAITFAAAGQGYSGAGEKLCCGDAPLNDFWRYSPTSDTWTRRNDIPDQSLGYNGTGIENNGYTVEGFGPTQISKYDPEADGWATVGEILNANFTGYPHYPVSIFTMDDRIFVFFRDEYNYTSADNYLYEFVLATGKWTRRAAYFDEKSVGFSINGTGYIAGFQYIHEYNLSTNTMTLNKIPLADNHWGVEYLFTANDKAYFLGAWANGHYELWEFDPAYL